MSERYEAFCMASSIFYDALHSERTAGKSFATADRPLPSDWRREDQDDWLVFAPVELDVPTQGWKIHLSATLDNADRILDAVFDYCVPRGIEFKFLRSRPALWLRSSKYAPRGYSGKLVTVYPHDEAACERILSELGDILDGEPSPYILSDVRWRNGPLYVRYGGFAARYCISDSGEVVLAIEDADGKLVPDRRDPVFYVPPWVTVPDFLAPQIAARNSVTVGELPYTFESVLHFSNGGGLYRGRDKRTGAEVVLKEARPHAGLDSIGDDAIRRLEREYEMLDRLAGVPAVPAVYDLFWVGEHRFLAMEYVDARPLHRELVHRYPMIDVAAEPADFDRYTEWALDVYHQVETALSEMHDRGVVYGDLHLFNIMIQPDGSVTLLDYEIASLVEENKRPSLGNQGFAAPTGTAGADVDRYALACLRLALFMPTTQILWLSRPKVAEFAQVIADHFRVPADFLAGAVDVIASAGTIPSPLHAELPTQPAGPVATGAPDLRVEPDPEGWPELRARLVRSIVASATPERADRLFPGDIEQFRFGGLGLAYGAAGVLHALAATGAGRFPELEDWFVGQAAQPPHGTRLGLYDGLHGVAYALDQLGHRERALDAIGMCMSDDWTSLGLDLFGGLSGIGLNLAHLADRTGESSLRDAAAQAAALVLDRLGDVESVPEISGEEYPYAGLFRGSSGPAVFLLRMYQQTGDPALLDAAAVALRQDLRRCIRRDNGVMEVNEGWRTMPYLATGSAGVGFALDEYLSHREDDEFADASKAVWRSAQCRLYVQSGLFNGRAGILLYQASHRPRPLAEPAVRAQLSALSWHALPFGGGMAFPGDQLLRLSMDVATGTAGVLLALGTVLHDAPVHLPLLAPTRARQPQVPAPSRRGLVSTPL